MAMVIDALIVNTNNTNKIFEDEKTSYGKIFVPECNKIKVGDILPFPTRYNICSAGIFDNRSSIGNKVLKIKYTNYEKFDECIDIVLHNFKKRGFTFKNDMDKFINTLYITGMNDKDILESVMRYMFEHYCFNQKCKNINSFKKYYKHEIEGLFFDFCYETCYEFYLDTNKYTSMSLDEYIDRSEMLSVYKYLINHYFKIITSEQLNKNNFCEIINKHTHCKEPSIIANTDRGSKYRVLLRLNQEKIISKINPVINIIDAELTRIAKLFNEGYFDDQDTYFRNTEMRHNDILGSKVMNWNPFDDVCDFIKPV